MNLPTELFGSVAVVHAPEELSADQVDAFEQCLGRIERNCIVLDLDPTEQLDSAGLTALLDVQDKLREVEGDLKLSATNPTNRKILEMTRLDRHLELFDSVIDAVRAFQ